MQIEVYLFAITFNPFRCPTVIGKIFSHMLFYT